MEQSDRAKRTAGWLALAGIGAVGGLFLGGLVTGNEFVAGSAGSVSYAELTGNPDALSVDVQPFEPCYDCAPGYGVAERLATSRFDRSDNHFRALGAVEVDTRPLDPPSDDYRYGGRFPDVAKHAAPVNDPTQQDGSAVQTRASITVSTLEAGDSKRIILVSPVPPAVAEQVPPDLITAREKSAKKGP